MTTTLKLISAPDALDDWLDACLASLPDTLARRATLVLPNHRIAHQLRRRLCLGGEAAKLLGVRIISAAELAQEALLRAGAWIEPGLDELRVPALRALVTASDPAMPLAYLDADAMRRGRGYAEALATAIADCEASGLDPAALRAAAQGAQNDDPLTSRRLLDLASLWEAVDDTLATEHEGVVSTAGLLLRAAAALTADQSLAARFGHVFVLLGLAPSVALVRFVAMLRPAATAMLIGRPARESALRMTESVAAALGASPSEPVPNSADARDEIGLIQDYLFAAPEILADSTRPTSHGPDGSVTFEHHPGVQREIDAAVSWVAEEVSERHTPLEEIALVVPARDPYSSMLVAALERADKGTEPSATFPAHVAGGLPLTESPSGTVLLALLRAVRDALGADRVIALMPHLRLEGTDRHHLGEAEARRMTHGCGIIGGTPGNAERGREWPERMRARAAALRRQLEMAEDLADDDPEKARSVLRNRDAGRLLAAIDAVLPSIDALTKLGALVMDGAPLADVVAGIRDFFRDYCLVPPGPPDAMGLLEEAVRRAAASGSLRSLAGHDAMRWLTESLHRLRQGHGRYGEPRVFVGTPSDVVGLRFRAVRLLGAVEGAVPPGPQEDPILPDEARTRLERHLRDSGVADVRLPGSSERVLAATHAAFHAATAAQERLVLSAPRRWIDGGEREVAGIVLEAAVALGRPDGDRAARVPSTGQLRSLYLDHGTTKRRERDRLRPVTARALARAAAAAGAGARRPVPPAWIGMLDGSVMALARLGAIDAEAGASRLLLADGLLGAASGAAAGLLSVPGIAAERGTSASALATLLACPHRFLLERVLHYDPPDERPATREIGQPHYGSLVHRVVEVFFQRHGPSFCRRDGGVDEWAELAREVARECFTDFLSQYPLATDGAVAAQRARLERDVVRLVEIEWRRPGRRYVGSEVAFGYPTPVRLDLEAGRAIQVHGYIDRLDAGPAGYLLCDVKTGKGKPLGRDPVAPDPDLQIAIYALVAQAGALGAGRSVAQAAYVYPASPGGEERLFAGEDLEQLLAQARDWLTLAADLLSGRAFPRAARAEACRFCSFKPVCGPEPTRMSRIKLMAEAEGSPARRLAELHGAEAEADDA